MSGASQDVQITFLFFCKKKLENDERFRGLLIDIISINFHGFFYPGLGLHYTDEKLPDMAQMVVKEVDFLMTSVSVAAFIQFMSEHGQEICNCITSYHKQIVN